MTKLEKTTNVAIIVACLALAGNLAWSRTEDRGLSVLREVKGEDYGQYNTVDDRG